MRHLDRIVTIVSGIGAALAIQASATAATGSTVAAAATALPALATIFATKTLLDAVKEGRRDASEAHFRDGIAAVQADLAVEDALSRSASPDRDRQEKAVTNILPLTIPKKEGAIQTLATDADLNGEKLAAALLARLPEHDSDASSIPVFLRKPA